MISEYKQKATQETALKYYKPVIWVAVMAVLAAYCVMFLKDLPNESEYAVYGKFAAIICAACLLAAGILLYLALFTKCKMETLFLFSFLSLGFVYNFVMTPHSVPDTAFHWLNATRVTNIWFEDSENREKFRTHDYYIEGATVHRNRKEVYATIMNTLFVQDDSDSTYDDIRRGRNYPVPYAPTAIGMTVGRLLPTSKIMLYYFGSLFNLMFSALLLYFAVKIAPKHKASIFVIAMLPMFLHQSASYSADAFINSMSILLMALLLREIYPKPALLPDSSFGLAQIKPANYVAIVIIGILLAPAKYVYSLLILAFLFIPKNRFKSTADFWIKSSVAIGLTFASAVFYFFVGAEEPPLPPPGTGYGSAPDASSLENILTGIQAIVTTATVRMQPLLYQCFGHKLSGLSLVVEEWLITAFILLFALTFINKESDSPAVGIKLRLTLVLISAAIYAGIAFTMYTAWGDNQLLPDGRIVINGVQGRYFIPLLLPIAVIFSNSIFVYKDKLERVFPTAAVLLNVIVITNILDRTINA